MAKQVIIHISTPSPEDFAKQLHSLNLPPKKKYNILDFTNTVKDFWEAHRKKPSYYWFTRKESFTIFLYMDKNSLIRHQEHQN